MTRSLILAMFPTSPNLNPALDEASSSNTVKSPDLEHAFGNINMHGEKSHVLVEPDEEELAELKCKMFGKIFNSSFLQLKLLEDELKKIRSSDEDIKLKPIGSGVFMFKISSEVLRNFIVEHSPWLVRGACMSFKAWNEGPIPHKIGFSMLEFWFQIYNLPLEFINSKNVLVLVKKLVSPVKTDNETFFNESGAFMRVKVKIDSRLPLPFGVEISRRDGSPEILPIRIKNLGLFCFVCGKLKHDLSKCSLGSFFIQRMSTPVSAKRYSIALKGITLSSRSIHLPIWHEHAEANRMKFDKVKPLEVSSESVSLRKADNIGFQGNSDRQTSHQKKGTAEHCSVSSVSKPATANFVACSSEQVSPQVNVANYSPRVPHQFFSNKIPPYLNFKNFNSPLKAHFVSNLNKSTIPSNPSKSLLQNT